MNCFTNNFRLFILLILIAFITQKGKCQLVVDTTATKEQLVEMLIDNGVYYENIALTCDQTSVGIFSHPKDSSNLSLGEGILLTTGKASSAMGPNTIGSRSGVSSSSGYDEDLAKLASPIKDRCVLEFDVIPVGNEISFNYIFASEEYPEYVGSSYNDVFGFFVSGPGLKGDFDREAVNIALVGEEKKYPVAVNTINAYATTSTKNFADLYVSNTSDESATDPLYIQYDGFTKTLQAKVEVIPCQKYHFKLAIGDVGDESYDSGVFIEKNSFKSNTFYADKTVSLGTCGTECDRSVTLNILDGNPDDYIISWTSEDGQKLEGGIRQENLCAGTNLTATIQPKNGGCDQLININIPEILMVTANSQGNNSSQSCNGKVSLNVSGGVPPYTYDWSNGSKEKELKDLCAGSYTVTVRDADQCSRVLAFDVSDEVKVTANTNEGVARGMPENVPEENVPEISELETAKKELEELIEENNILLFEKNQVEIKEVNYSYLNKLATALKKDSSLKIQIVGHASSEGSFAFNMEISQNRAEQVLNYLLEEGVGKEQLEISAKGEGELYKDENSEEDRKQNRRVEIIY